MSPRAAKRYGNVMNFQRTCFRSASHDRLITLITPAT